jgi:hypothetical protein
VNDALNLQLREVPARIADLDFVVELPADWISHPLQEEALDFDNPAFLVPLAVVTAPHAVIVWSAAARPGYGEGTLSDWARYLLGEHGLEPRTFSDAWLGDLPAILGEAEQPSDYGPMRVRFAFAEDGGRLINVTLSAPSQLASAIESAWRATLSSFRLGTPHGPTVTLWPAPSTDDSAVVQYDEYVAPPEPEKGPMPGSDTSPPWWNAARALEAAGHLDEAELAIRSAVPHQGALIQIAELYRLRQIRLREAGDVEGARRARLQAVNWAQAYAASATSGGEGTALSAERDAFIADLGPE